MDCLLIEVHCLAISAAFSVLMPRLALIGAGPSHSKTKCRMKLRLMASRVAG